MEKSEVAAAPRSLKEKQRREREALILQAAEEVLTEKGYYETSIDEIAARVGIAKGTVYLHFPSKEDLVVAIFMRDIQQLIEKVCEISALEQSASEKMRAILHCIYGKVYAKRMRLLFRMTNNVESLHHWKERGQKLFGVWEKLAQLISDVLEQGRASGEFSSEIPTSVMLSTFFCLLSPRSYERLVLEEEMDANALVGYLERLYFKGITRN
ncbi:MAG TPA: TetR/AcrR family transcriptional regulator [Ktedonobacteraceae bacterium]|nr:TetR/AcrR family transcriptional regulator [Ktedonobacteraceae bacterium]